MILLPCVTAITPLLRATHIRATRRRYRMQVVIMNIFLLVGLRTKWVVIGRQSLASTLTPCKP